MGKNYKVTDLHRTVTLDTYMGYIVIWATQLHVTHSYRGCTVMGQTVTWDTESHGTHSDMGCTVTVNLFLLDGGRRTNCDF